jgi:lactate 2-monooxygenase
MPEHTRRQFLGSVGSAAAATALVPGALAAGRPAPAGAQSAAAGTPSTYFAYQSEIYFAGMSRGVTPKLTTNLSDLEAEANKVLDPQARRHLLAGAGGSVAVRANARAFRGWRIVPRMFVDRAERDLSATVLGTRMPAAVIFAPVGRQRLAHPEGDLASARAAAALQLTYVRSAQSGHSLEEVAAANGTASRWHQLDWPDDGDLDVGGLRRARLAGYTHLVLTPPRSGRSWSQLGPIRRSWDGPMILYGVQTVRDAKLASQRRFDGIVVSNHRGSTGDGVTGTVDALPPIVDAVGDRLAVLFDSGIRMAPDAYKALALGADAVLVGRPYVYGLALDGQAGVTHVMRTLLAELDLTLANAGLRSQRKLSRGSLARAD